MSKTNSCSKKRKVRMIRWRLRVLMAERKINNKNLAKLTGLHPTTISRLKNTDELKQISGEALDALCNALTCTPNDLIAFTPSNNPSTSTKVNKFSSLKSSSSVENQPFKIKEKQKRQSFELIA